MSPHLLYLTTAILGYISVYIIGFNFKSNRQTNAYLILFFFLSSTRFLFYGMPNIPFQKNILFFMNVLFTVTSWPCLYLYFTHLIKKRSEISAKDGLHFLLPSVVVFLALIIGILTDSALAILIPITGFINLAVNFCYYYLSYKLLAKNVWQRNSSITLIDKHNKAIRKWTTFLFAVFSLVFLRVLVNFFIVDKAVWTSNKNGYLWVGALIWIVVYARILTDPEFLYGYDVLQTKIKEYKKRTIVLDNIWKTEFVKSDISLKDGVLKEKIQSNVEGYIIEIEHLALHSNLFFTETFSAEDLANTLSIPKSHLLYVFKYHSNVSFSDFKKIIRIQRAITLMEQDYLKNNTLESLAIAVGFSSYSPFFKSFKSITGLSPQEYIRN